jgi:hypothetical protein
MYFWNLPNKMKEVINTSLKKASTAMVGESCWQKWPISLKDIS